MNPVRMFCYVTDLLAVNKKSEGVITVEVVQPIGSGRSPYGFPNLFRANFLRSRHLLF